MQNIFLKNKILLLPLLFLIFLPFTTNAFSIIDPDQCHGTLSFPPGTKYCTLCDGLNTIKTVTNYMIEVGAILAVLVITYGAIQIMLGGAMPSKIQQGRSAITGAIVGVILMLVSWLIINQVFYLLVVNNVTGKPWNQIDCPPEETLTASNGPGGVVLPNSSRAPQPTSRTGNDVAASNLIRAQLLSASGGKITVNNDCPQTCLDGLSTSAQSGAVSFQSRSGCPIVITGGTEVSGGHATGPNSHQSGNKLDFRLSSCVDNFIAGNTGNGANGFVRTGIRSDGATLYRDTNTGHIYARETNHWDIRF